MALSKDQSARFDNLLEEKTNEFLARVESSATEDDWDMYAGKRQIEMLLDLKNDLATPASRQRKREVY